MTWGCSHPTTSAHVLTAVFVVAYAAFSVPAVAAGLLVLPLGLFATTCWYVALVALMATTAALLRNPRLTAPQRDQLPQACPTLEYNLIILSYEYSHESLPFERITTP